MRRLSTFTGTGTGSSTGTGTGTDTSTSTSTFFAIVRRVSLVLNCFAVTCLHHIMVVCASLVQTIRSHVFNISAFSHSHFSSDLFIC